MMSSLSSLLCSDAGYGMDKICGKLLESSPNSYRSHENNRLGIVAFMFGLLLMLPFFVKKKAYDVVALLSLMIVISSSSLILG